jgi:hypothetical protein
MFFRGCVDETEREREREQAYVRKEMVRLSDSILLTPDIPKGQQRTSNPEISRLLSRMATSALRSSQTGEDAGDWGCMPEAGYEHWQ